jgi:hypothetical protein
MREMIREVLGWHRPLWSGRAPGRCTRWARSLAERHGQIPFRHRAVTMTLVRPMANLYLLCQRWQSHAWRLCPQINLSIAPILREPIWKEFPVLRNNQINSGSFRGHWKDLSVLQRDQVDQVNPGSFTGNRPIFRNSLAVIHDRDVFDSLDIVPFVQRDQGDQAHAGPFTRNRAIFLNPLAAIYDRDVFGSRDIAVRGEELFGATPAYGWRAPLRRVFERMDEVESVTRLHLQSLLTQRSLQILRRVVHQGQRVEEKKQHVTVARQVLQHQKDRPAAAPEPTTFAPQSSMGANPQAWPHVASPPGINIEHLTEQVVRQIDRRLLSWRERTGRMF